jgi:redox-sensing transcriptional repressor
MAKLSINADLIKEDSIKRYPVYLKICRKLKRHGYSITQSKELEEYTRIDARTIRKDLAKLGKLGIKSKGYDLDVLIDGLSEALGMESKENIILVGVGDLGGALLNYNAWTNVTGKIVCAFDEHPEKSKYKGKIKVHKISELKRKMPEGCRIAILCTSTHTQDIVNKLIDNGIEGIVNFTLQPIEVPETVSVNTVDLVSNIQELVMKLNIKSTLSENFENNFNSEF